MITVRNSVLVLLGLLAALPSAVNANELVTNGGFESNLGTGQLGFNTSATGWLVADPSQGQSYTFLFAPGTSDTSGADGQYGNLALWGPNNGSSNGLPSSSPNGGYFIGQDSGGFQSGDVSQDISGLTIGQSYVLNFDWAASQQWLFDGASQSGWIASLGSEAYSTPVLSIDNHGFSGWQTSSFTYTATATTETLSFLAQGSPYGVPPFALLDGVSLQAVPETGTGLTMLMGVLGFGLFARRRARTTKSGN